MSNSANTSKKDLLMDKRAFLLVAIVTGLILLIPYLGMKFDWKMVDPGNPIPQRINWELEDFMVMGTLLFGMGSLFVVAARKFKNIFQRIAIGIVLTVALLYLWAELAVGIFTNWGS